MHAQLVYHDAQNLTSLLSASRPEFGLLCPKQTRPAAFTGQGAKLKLGAESLGFFPFNDDFGSQLAIGGDAVLRLVAG